MKHIGRGIIRLNDKTDHGGKVVTVSSGTVVMGAEAALSTRQEINVNFGIQNRMRCKAATAPQCEHCKQEPTQQRAGYVSQKHIYL